jgi:hypothetical protein
VTIKVFLSHQRADSARAAEIATRLRVYHTIDSYLDIIDPYLGRPGEDLANHIRTQMSSCTQLLAVVSYSTKESQWVPWEIGVATEKDFPLATFADYMSPVPEFLATWPYLRNMSDVDKYAAASKGANQRFVQRKATASFGEARREGTMQFYRDIRSQLSR